MDNLISGITQPNLPQGNPEFGISAEIVNIRSELLANLKVGQSYFLQNINLSGEDIFSADMNLSENVTEKVELSLNKNMNVAVDEIKNVQIKINQVTPSSVKITIQKINQENPGKYILKDFGQTNTDSPLTIDISNASKTFSSSNVAYPQNVKAENVLVINTKTDFAAQKFYEMPISQILTQVFAKDNLSPKMVKFVEDNFNSARISVEIEKVVSLKDAPLEKLFPQFEKAVENSIERIGLILKKVSEQIEQPDTSISTLKENLTQLKQEIIQWKNMPLPAQAYSKPDNKLLALRSFIGNFLPESALKVENNVKILLKIKDMFLPQDTQEKELYLNDLLASQKLVEKLPKFSQIMRALFVNTPAEEKIEQIFKNITPLDSFKGKEIVQEIINKFPTDNEQMLPNMLKFIKAGGEKNIELWLGKEIISDLQNMGKEGLEISQKLTDFFNASVKENANWKIVDIPFLNGENINRIRIAIKNFMEEEKNEQEKRRRKSARFVVDTSFSNLGNFQFDGFSFSKERQFDLIIRTSRNIPQDLKQNIFAIFKNTLHQLEYKGTIKLNVKENFIKIYENEVKEDTLEQGIYI